MAGLMHFRGEGTLRNVHKAHQLFSQVPKDEVADFMLIVMDYFEMLLPDTKERALNTMQSNSLSNQKKLPASKDFLI